MTAPQAEATTDPQSIIAALQQRLNAALSEKAALADELAAHATEMATRTAELAERKTAFDERIEYQAATVDVLKVMSASPGDPQPVFDLIARRANELCNGAGVALFGFDGRLVHYRTDTGVPLNSEARTKYLAMFPMVPTRGSITCRAILEKRVIHVPNFQADPELLPIIKALGWTAQLSVPLMREGSAIGVITLVNRANAFTDSQIELLKTFAEQAVIAITSAETYRALQTRTSDLQETLEYQTATSDVLKVISRSTFDLQPVLDAVVETAARLCDADSAVIARREGELIRGVAFHGYSPEYRAWIKSLGAIPLDGSTVGHRAVLEGRVVHVHDVAADPNYLAELIVLGKQRTSLGVPLLREGEAIGMIVLSRQRVEPFTDRQIELVSTFADQAVIAIENTRLIIEQREALEQQTATAEVLQVINASPGDLKPVFDAILDKAMRLCEAAFGTFYLKDGDQYPMVATRGLSHEYAAFRRTRPPYKPRPGSPPARVQETRAPLQILDMTAEDAYRSGNPETRALVDLGGARTVLYIPLLKDEAVTGTVVIYRQEVRSFTDRQIALLQNFAAQAVIAMENARLLTEQREALEQQTATAEVLQVINASPGDLAPVFDAMLEKATRICEANFGILYRFDGEVFRAEAVRDAIPAYIEFLRRNPPRPDPRNALGRLFQTKRPVHVLDIKAELAYAEREPTRVATVEIAGARTFLAVPMLKEDQLIGAIAIYRQEVRPFSEMQIELVASFARQAIIAIENARLLQELRNRTDELAQRQVELRVTFENMGDGVAMFDEIPRLVAWNRKFQEIFNVPDAILEEHRTYAEYVRYLGMRGDFGPNVDVEKQIRRLTEIAGECHAYERVRPDGRVIEIRHNPVPGGGFVLIYADITERKRSEAEIRAARDAAETALRELRTAQANLIQAEKMASLGQLTAGIAHEIKNPLNFVNNFAALSVDLLGELKETAAPGFAALTDKQRAEVEEVSEMLTSNLEKITEHGKRADGIVKAMLEHSRGSSGERRMVDLNALIDEALNLAYHGARAQDQSFNITLERDFGEGIAPIEVNPQDITRVFLNIFSNGFYATTKRTRDGGDAGFVPTLKVTTRDAGEAVEIRVRDNGTGVPTQIRDKLFQPFFTTKPTGEGTGLGLSITYDIVTQQHSGSIAVDSAVGEYSEFIIRLPHEP